jgi:catechol O-methyltransferase
LIDHAKNLYLSDFKLLEEYGVIKKGTLVLGDNIIYPGSKEYLEHFKERNDYDSTLIHSFVEYSNISDAILVSEKL